MSFSMTYITFTKIFTQSPNFRPSSKIFAGGAVAPTLIGLSSQGVFIFPVCWLTAKFSLPVITEFGNIHRDLLHMLYVTKNQFIKTGTH